MQKHSSRILADDIYSTAYTVIAHCYRCISVLWLNHYQEISFGIAGFCVLLFG
jgi:hypothetical protein